MQRKYQEIANPITQATQEFVNRHLRFSTMEEERLELQLGPRWPYKKAATEVSEPNKSIRSSVHKTNLEHSNFYNLVMLLFPEVSSQPAVDIAVMDTLFFLPDHSLHYVYQDSRKGLVRLKQRGIAICDAFLKRKLRRKQNPFRQKYLHKTKSTITLNDQKSQKTISANLDYFALLKYKDGSFLRLKQNDFRAIFTNPLYANERFKHNNCTQYIQALPSEEAEEIRIYYKWSQFKDQPLTQAAKQSQLGNTPALGQRQAIRSALQSINPTVYLYYTIFELCTYISIHYGKRLQSAHFTFVCEDDVWILSGAEGIKISTPAQKEYVRAELWQPHKVRFGVTESQNIGVPIFQEKPEEKTLLYQTLESYFDRTNTTIRKDITSFVKKQIDRVRKVQDQKLSKAIFEILHPGKGNQLYQCLDSPEKMKKAINLKDRKKLSKSRVEIKPPGPRKMTTKLTILQQMVHRQQQKERLVYRGIYQ